MVFVIGITMENTIEFIEVKFENGNWDIVYGEEKKKYKAGVEKFISDGFTVNGHYYPYNKGGGDDYDWVGSVKIEDKYKEAVRKNPNQNLEVLLKKLVVEANEYISERNRSLVSDPYNSYYDSTDSNHWTEG